MINRWFCVKSLCAKLENPGSLQSSRAPINLSETAELGNMNTLQSSMAPSYQVSGAALQ